MAATIVALLSAIIWLSPLIVNVVRRLSRQPLDVTANEASVLGTVLALLTAVGALARMGLRIVQSGRERLTGAAGQQSGKAAVLSLLRAHLGGSTRLPLIAEESALRLRVHRAIQLAGSNHAPHAPNRAGQSRLRSWLGSRAERIDPDLPAFVPRDIGEEVVKYLRTARRTGGFLLLIGDSSVGKTRLLYESARRELGNFPVLAPDFGDGDLVNKMTEAGLLPRRLIIWLDELQRFIDGPYLRGGSTPITAATIRRLLAARSPVLVLATMWPETAAQLRATDVNPVTGRSEDRHPAAADVLNYPLIKELTVRTFSKAETERAAALATTDDRLASALGHHAFGVTEVLAGAPELMRRYDHAPPDQRAVLLAAIDSRRLGIQTPITERFLQDAARGYLTARQPDNRWFPQTLANLVGEASASCPLVPVLDEDRREVLGYDVAEYLQQRAGSARRHEPLPARMWEALLVHTYERQDLARLALAAYNRWRYCYSLPLYKQLVELDNTAEADMDFRARLAQQTAAMGSMQPDARTDTAVDAGAANTINHVTLEEHRREPDRDEPQARDVDDLLMHAGDISGLRARSDQDDRLADVRLAYLLASRGDLDQLMEEINAGNQFAGELYADLLEEHGRVPEADRMRRYGLTADGRIPQRELPTN